MPIPESPPLKPHEVYIGDSDIEEAARELDDVEGLDHAYDNLSNHTYIAGNTEYVAGTDLRHTPGQDVYDDVVHIPTRTVSEAARYKQARRELLKKPWIKRLVGHSLGGAVVQRLADEFPDVEFVTYGAPTLSSGRGIAYRHPGDPISMTNSEAVNQLYIGNPHSYRGFTSTNKGKDQGLRTKKVDLKPWRGKRVRRADFARRR